MTNPTRSFVYGIMYQSSTTFVLVFTRSVLPSDWKERLPPRIVFSIYLSFQIYTHTKSAKSTPDMYYPSHPYDGRGAFNTYPHGHSLLLLRLCVNFAKIRISREQRFNKRLTLCTHFFTLLSPAVRVLRLERDDILYSYAILINGIAR